MAIDCRLVSDAKSRRYFRAWDSLTSRKTLYAIVKGRLDEVAASLEREGRSAEAAQPRDVSPHWLRHTFAKALIVRGRNIRVVAESSWKAVQVRTDSLSPNTSANNKLDIASRPKKACYSLLRRVNASPMSVIHVNAIELGSGTSTLSLSRILVITAVPLQLNPLSKRFGRFA